MLYESNTYAGDDEPLKSWWGQLNRFKIIDSIEKYFKF